MISLILFFVLNIQAAPEALPLIENTFPRDNTYCSQGKNRVEYLVRGSSKYTQERESYGEYLFFQNSKKEEKFIIPSAPGHFRLLKGKSTLCTKGHGHKIGRDKFALLFQKDNRPFKDLLLIQFLDEKTLAPLDNLQTTFPVDKAEGVSRGFSFRTYDIHPLRDLMQISYEGENYLYQEKDFFYWMNYTDKGFETNPKKTFKDFIYKDYFKNRKEFLKAAGWDKKEKVFRKKFLFHGVSHKLKKDCVLFTESQEKLPNEDWVCQTKKAE